MSSNEKIFYHAVEIADILFSLSMLEDGRITPEMAQEGERAALAYMGTFLPSSLTRK